MKASNHAPSSNVQIPWYRPLSWLRALYDWVMSWAEHPWAVRGLAILAASEAIFFPIPVDPLLLAMGTARPSKALRWAFVATLFSVLGGLAGYALGFAFWSATDQFFYEFIVSRENFELVLEKFQNNAFWTLFLAGFTPIPFKVFTLAAGVAHLGLFPFILGSLLGRAGRYYLIGILLFFFGPPIRSFIEKYMEKISLATGIVIVLGLILYNWLI